MSDAASCPPALLRASSEFMRYLEGTTGETRADLFGKKIIPYSKSSEEFWWAVLIHVKPFRGAFGGEQALISDVSVNLSQTPKEEVQILGKDTLMSYGLDAEYILDDSCETRTLTVIQINPTSNFLDKSVYKQVQIEEWKFAEYVVSNLLCLHLSEVPMFLGYQMNVFGFGIKKCIELEHNVSLRSTPANLLTIDKKTLAAPVDIHGKVFVVAKNRHLTAPEMQEIVIFCMGQAETSELKLRSWEKLKDTLQEEARKFAMSASHLRPPA